MPSHVKSSGSSIQHVSTGHCTACMQGKDRSNIQNDSTGHCIGGYEALGGGLYQGSPSGAGACCSTPGSPIRAVSTGRCVASA
eukprot:1493747-Rhodomonas_salina.2